MSDIATNVPMSDPSAALGVVSPSQQTTGTAPVVHTTLVQAPSTVTTPSSTTPDVTGIITQYEQRIRNLMSEKDKAVHERNQAITSQTTLQEQLTTLQNQTQSSLTGAANAAQQAIDRGKQLESQIAQLQGEALRANTLLEKPHLAPYANFIPAINDPEKIKKTIEQLEQIRQRDLEQNRAQFGGGPVQQQQQQTTTTANPGQTLQNVAQLYQGRQNMPMSLQQMPGSTPAQMNPSAYSDPTVLIQKLFDDAKKSGNPADFEKAIQEAAVLSQTAINQQLGRSS